MKSRNLMWILVAGLLMLSVAPVLAAGGEHGEAASQWTPQLVMWRIVNTVVLFIILIYFLKKPLVNFFSERKEKIRRDLEDAKDQRIQAETKLKEYEDKLAGMEQELEKMRAELKQAADLESEKVVANAERMAEGMVETAKLAAEQEVRKAKATLRNEAVELAMELAESLIREKINDADRKKIVEDYLGKVGGMK